jgi:hypothetical protein
VRCTIDGKARAVAGVVGERQTGLNLPMDRLAALVTCD